MSHKHYEQSLIKLVVAEATQHRVAVDVGANIGSHAVAYARDFEMVYAFEPHPTTFPFLKTNVEINELTNVVASEVALGETARTAHMAVVPNVDLTGARIHSWGTEVEMRTLDSYDLPEVDLIKIDVEGYEGQVISGAAGTIRRCRPLIMFEQVRPSLFDIFGFLLMDMKYERITAYSKNYLAHP